jgi:hypothetical protein
VAKWFSLTGIAKVVAVLLIFSMRWIKYYVSSLRNLHWRPGLRRGPSWRSSRRSPDSPDPTPRRLEFGLPPLVFTSNPTQQINLRQLNTCSLILLSTFDLISSFKRIISPPLTPVPTKKIKLPRYTLRQRRGPNQFKLNQSTGISRSFLMQIVS